MDKEFHSYVLRNTRNNTENYNFAKSQILVSQSLLEKCEHEPSSCTDAMVFPGTYFESPFINRVRIVSTSRSYYNYFDLFIVICLNYQEQRGGLWWYQDHAEFAYINKVQRYLNGLRWVVTTFLPVYLEEYKYVQLYPEAIAMQDWFEESDAITIMERLTKVLSKP